MTNKAQRLLGMIETYSDTGRTRTVGEVEYRIITNNETGKEVFEPIDMKKYVITNRMKEFGQRLHVMGKNFGKGKTNTLAKTITLSDGFKVDRVSGNPLGGKEWSDGWEEKSVLKKSNEDKIL